MTDLSGAFSFLQNMPDNSLMFSNQFKWYVIYTQPNYERKVLKMAVRKNMECFLPTQKVVRQWSDRKKTLDVPLFPNYLFVCVKNEERFKLLDITGVIRFINYDSKPVVLSDFQMLQIKKITESPDALLEEKFEEGDFVEITCEPFQGLKGLLIKRKGKNRFAIKIEGVNNIISIPTDNLTMVKIDLAY